MMYLLPLLAFAAATAAFLTYCLNAPITLDDDVAPPATSTYRIAQHYWRELGQARDWDGLKAQVRQWQELAGPGWTEAEVEDIARHLNQAVYRFAEPAPVH